MRGSVPPTVMRGETRAARSASTHREVQLDSVHGLLERPRKLVLP